MRKKIIVRRNLKEELFHKETTAEKIKKHAFDVIMLAMMGLAAFLIIQNEIQKIPLQKSATENTNPVPKDKSATILNISRQNTR